MPDIGRARELEKLRHKAIFYLKIRNLDFISRDSGKERITKVTHHPIFS
jgi:hypothetical protein